MISRLTVPGRALAFVALAATACAVAIPPWLEARTQGYAVFPPSQGFLIALGEASVRGLGFGAALFVALALPWIVAGGRPVARPTIARVWAFVIALVPWIVVGLRYNLDISGSWHTTRDVLGIGVPVALTTPAILLRNAGITGGAIVLGLLAFGFLRATLPRERFRRPPRALVGALLVVVAALVAGGGPLRDVLRPTPSGPDLVLISLDAMRADHIGAYGGPDGLTPALDALAARGIVFERAYAQEPWTLSSHMSMLTALYPDAHDVDRRRRPLAPTRWTVTERLREGGYRTAASVMACHWLSPDYGFGAGFDVYEENTLAAAARVEAAADWLLADERPGFLFLHLYDPHSDWGELPYEASAEARRRFAPGAARGFADWTPEGGASAALARVNDGELSMPDSLRASTRALYAAGVHDTDAALARFFERLDAAGRLEDTVVLVVADHGEALGEDGLFLHGELQEATLRVPTILKLSGDRRAGERIDRLVETIDVAPTLLELAGLPPLNPSQGRSVLAPVERRFAAHRRGREHAITTDDGWRLRYTFDRSGIFPLGLRAVTGIASEGPDVLADSLHVVDAWIEPIQDLHRANDALARPGAAGEVTLDAADRELLRSLGYIE